MIKTRETVACRSYLDGQLSREWAETRMVYENSRGLFVNHLGRRKRATRQEDGTVLVVFDVRTICSALSPEICLSDECCRS